MTRQDKGTGMGKGTAVRRALAAVALATAIQAPAWAQGTLDESQLEAMYQLTYGKQLAGLSVDDMVAAFKQGARGKAEDQKCPALGTAIDDFSDTRVRQVIADYFGSPALKDAIKAEMRKHYTQDDIAAYLAFARSPAGTSFLAHQALTDPAVEATVKAKTQSIAETPEFGTMVGEMTAKLLPVMLQCQKAK